MTTDELREFRAHVRAQLEHVRARPQACSWSAITDFMEGRLNFLRNGALLSTMRGSHKGW